MHSLLFQYELSTLRVGHHDLLVELAQMIGKVCSHLQLTYRIDLLVYDICHPIEIVKYDEVGLFPLRAIDAARHYIAQVSSFEQSSVATSLGGVEGDDQYLFLSNAEGDHLHIYLDNGREVRCIKEIDVTAFVV